MSLYDRHISQVVSFFKEPSEDIHEENLRLFGTFLNNHKIDFHLASGTALGAVRDHDIIKKDSDVDIAVPEEYRKVILENIKEFENLGFKVMRYHNNKKDRFMSLYRKKQYLDIDFFKRGERCISIDRGRPCDEFMNALEPYQNCQIRGVNYKCPSERYLELLYGDWKTPRNIHADQIKR